MNLEELAEQKVKEFLFVLSPLKWKGATASLAGSTAGRGEPVNIHISTLCHQDHKYCIRYCFPDREESDSENKITSLK